MEGKRNNFEKYFYKLALGNNEFEIKNKTNFVSLPPRL